ncbi:MAG: hypothetical protein ACQETA_07780 [Bacteroidota bacterium]
MKKHLLLLFIFFSYPLFSFSQAGSEVALFYGKSTGYLFPCIIRSGLVMGTGSHSLKKSNSFGIRYFSDFNGRGRMGYELGVNYMNAKVEFKSDADPDADPEIRNYMLLSTPVYVNHNFWKYFYFNYGLMLDYQIYDKETDFGIGIGFGLSARYDFSNYFFYVNPKYEKHLFLYEELGLNEFGVMLGLGYRF